MADLTRDDLNRLRALLDEASPVPWSDQGHVLAPGDSELLFAAVNALPALLDAAERGLDDGLRFVPIAGEQMSLRAMATDGAIYEAWWFGASWRWRQMGSPDALAAATESEAIEAARAHDRARRAKGTT